MNLYHLRYFTVLAQFEHYTKAAEHLAIAQPSLSHAIASLEEEIGVKLFEKHGRNIILTKYGKAFLQDVKKILEQLDSSIDRLHSIAHGEGIVDLALLRTLSTNLVPSLVRGFLNERPLRQIDFRFHNDTGLTPDIIAGVKSEKYDLAFCSKMLNEPSIEFIPIAKQKLVVIVPTIHPLANLKTITLSETLPYPHVAFSKRSGLRPIIDRLFEESCQTKPNIAYEVEEDHAVAGLVANYFGISVVPNMPILNLMNIKKIHISDLAWERNFYMAFLKDTYKAPVVEEFKSYVIEHSDLTRSKSKVY